MSDSISDEELIKQARELVLARYAQKRKLEQETRTYSTRTAKISKAYRGKILETVLASAGISQEEIRKRQTENNGADQKFLASLQPIVDENVRETNERTKLLLQGIREKRKLGKFQPAPLDRCPPAVPPPLPCYSFLPTAGTITYDDPFDPPLPDFNGSSGHEENIVQFTTGTTQAQYFITVPFVWCPPTDGWLDLLSVVAFNGSAWWGAKHGCLETLLEMEGDIGIWVVDTTAGTPPDPCNLQSFFYKYRDWTPGCSSDIGMELIDQPVLLTAPNRTWVTAGHKLVIMVMFMVQFWGDDAIGLIDFATNGKSINVTGVFADLYADQS